MHDLPTGGHRTDSPTGERMMTPRNSPADDSSRDESLQLRTTAELVARSIATGEHAAEGGRAARPRLADRPPSNRPLLETHQLLVSDLRDAVVEFTRARRARGAPPEEVIVHVKGAVADATRTQLPSAEVAELVTSATRWTIDAYYAVRAED